MKGITFNPIFLTVHVAAIASAFLQVSAAMAANGCWQQGVSYGTSTSSSQDHYICVTYAPSCSTKVHISSGGSNGALCPASSKKMTGRITLEMAEAAVVPSTSASPTNTAKKTPTQSAPPTAGGSSAKIDQEFNAIFGAPDEQTKAENKAKATAITQEVFGDKSDPNSNAAKIAAPSGAPTSTTAPTSVPAPMLGYQGQATDQSGASNAGWENSMNMSVDNQTVAPTPDGSIPTQSSEAQAIAAHIQDLKNQRDAVAPGGADSVNQRKDLTAQIKRTEELSGRNFDQEYADARANKAPAETLKKITADKNEYNKLVEDSSGNAKSASSKESGSGNSDTAKTDSTKSSSDKKSKAAAVNDACSNSASIDKNGKYLCDPTNTAINAAGAVAQSADAAGVIATGIGSAAALGSAKAGSISDTYNKSGDANMVAAVSQWAASAVNIGMGGFLNNRARIHGSNGQEISQARTELESKRLIAEGNRDFAKTDEDRARYQKEVDDLNGQIDVHGAAITEQKKFEEMANIASLASHSKGVERGMAGLQSMMAAQQNYKSGCVNGVGTTCDTTPFTGNNGTNLPNGDVVVTPVNPDTSNSETGPENITQQEVPNGLGDSLGGIPPAGGNLSPYTGGPTAAGPGAGGGNGAGASGIGGSSATQAAKDEEAGGPKLADSKSPYYASSSGGGSSGGGASGGKGAGSGMPDLAAMIAAAFGKKDGEANKDPKGILAFGSNAGNESLLNPEVNIFGRVHDAYQEKQRTNTVGLLQFGGNRGVASKPAVKR